MNSFFIFLAAWIIYVQCDCATQECCTKIEDEDNACTLCFEDSGCTAYSLTSSELQTVTCKLKGSEPPSVGSEVLAISTGCKKDVEDECEKLTDCLSCNRQACEWCPGPLDIGSSCSASCSVVTPTPLEKCEQTPCENDACCEMLEDADFACSTCFGNENCVAYVAGTDEVQVSLTCRHVASSAPSVGKKATVIDDCAYDKESRCEKFRECATCAGADGCNWCPGSILKLASDGCTADVCDDAIPLEKCEEPGVADKCDEFERCTDCAEASVGCEWCNTASSLTAGVINSFSCKAKGECAPKDVTELEFCAAERPVVATLLALSMLLLGAAL